MLFTPDEQSVFLEGLFRGQSAFMLCAGPSLVTHDLAKLRQRGVLTCAVNNAAAVFRPQLWVSVDDPAHFCDAIWYDPGVLKFVPLSHMDKRFLVRDQRDNLVPSPHVVGEMPAVFGYRRNEEFVAERWLDEETFNWGHHSARRDACGCKGSRSVMYVALRMLFYLGVRRVYLLGCDFRMSRKGQNYAFQQHRTLASVRGNNRSYRILNVRLARLKPYFEKEGYEVYNCTPNSGLAVFPYVPFEEAVAGARALIPERINTAGMYDRKPGQTSAKRSGPEKGDKSNLCEAPSGPLRGKLDLSPFSRRLRPEQRT